MIIYLIKLILILVFNIGNNTYCINSECKCCCCNTKLREIGGGSKCNLSTNPPKGTNPQKGPNQIVGPQMEEMRSENKGNLYHNPAKDTNTSLDTNSQEIKTSEGAKHNNDSNQILSNNSLNASHVSEGGDKKVDKIAIDLDNGTFECNEDILTTGFKKIGKTLPNNVKSVIHKDFMYGENIYYSIDKDIFNSIKEDSNVEIIKNLYSDNYIVFVVKTQVEEFKEENQKYDYYLVYCHNGNTSVNINGLFDSIDTNVEIKILGSGNKLMNINYMFYVCKNLKKITFNQTCFKTSNVTNMTGMFYGCSSLERLNLNNFDTSNVTNMNGMFEGCSSLKKLNLSSFNTNNVTNMSDMFYGCSSLEELNLNNFNTNKVTDMSCMFMRCSSLKKINLSNFNNNNVIYMNRMFYGCSSLEELNLNNFNTGKVTSMIGMFYGCSSLERLNLNNFDTSNVTDMSGMFYGCSLLEELNLSSFNISKVTDISNMFYGCSSLKELNLSNFNTNKVTDIRGMFDGCDKLKSSVTTKDKKIINNYTKFIKKANK